MLSERLPPHEKEWLVRFNFPGNTGTTCAFLDIGFPEIKLAVEVDGGVHHHQERKAADVVRSKKLESMDWTIIRFWNSEVHKDTSRCAEIVIQKIQQLSTR